MLRNALIVGALAAIAVAALVDTLHGGEAAAPARGPDEPQLRRLAGPDVPAPGALPGSLVVVEAGDCRLRVISFEDGSLGEAGAETLCRVWASPTSGLAVAETSQGERVGTRELALVDLGDLSDGGRVLGPARGEVAWAPDGARVAWCSLRGSSIVLELASGSEREVAGCDPRFAPDGALLTRPDGEAELWRDGEPLLTADDLARGFEPGGSRRVELVDYDVSSDGTLAVSVARPMPSGTAVVLELWRAGSLATSFALPAVRGPGNTRFGGFLRFGPAGNELAVGYTPGAGALTLVDLGLERLAIPEIAQSGLAWSPDGAWLALAVGNEIRVYGSVRDEPSYVLPVAARSIAWSPGEEPAAAG